MTEMDLYKKLASAELKAAHFHERWQTQCNIANALAAERVVLADKIRDLEKQTVLRCIDVIETYRVPVCNSTTAAELSSELTVEALCELQDQLKEEFGVA
jgi:hypothetical protein